jgi:hypothetical protein
MEALKTRGIGNLSLYVRGVTAGSASLYRRGVSTAPRPPTLGDRRRASPGHAMTHASPSPRTTTPGMKVPKQIWPMVFTPRAFYREVHSAAQPWSSLVSEVGYVAAAGGAGSAADIEQAVTCHMEHQAADRLSRAGVPPRATPSTTSVALEPPNPKCCTTPAPGSP